MELGARNVCVCEVTLAKVKAPSTRCTKAECCLLPAATHNSYHIAPRPDLVESVMSNPLVQALLPKSDYIPQAWEYTHLPLDQQLDLGKQRQA